MTEPAHARSEPFVIARGTLHGCDFVRLYLVDPVSADLLLDFADRYEYTFAYSLADLGNVDGFTREEKATQLIHLDSSTDEVFEGLNKNNRYKIRRSYRDPGVEVVRDDPGRENSLRFYREMKIADGVIPDIDEDFTTVRWINGYVDRALTSATCWFDSGEVLRAKHIVSVRKESGADTSLIGRLTRRLFWEACELGIESGRRLVDLGGIDLAREEKSGVAEFKQSFGGERAAVFVYRSSGPLWERSVAQAASQDRTVV